MKGIFVTEEEIIVSRWRKEGRQTLRISMYVIGCKVESCLPLAGRAPVFSVREINR